MNFLKMAKEAAAMKSKMAKIDEALRAKILEVESSGIKITINAKNEFIDVVLPEKFFTEDKEKAQKQLLKALNEASNKAQSAMAEEARKMAGDLKLPGM
jgi:DNA-binding protein YbaB